MTTDKASVADDKGVTGEGHRSSEVDLSPDELEALKRDQEELKQLKDIFYRDGLVENPDQAKKMFTGLKSKMQALSLAQKHDLYKDLVSDDADDDDEPRRVHDGNRPRAKKTMGSTALLKADTFENTIDTMAALDPHFAERKDDVIDLIGRSEEHKSNLRAGRIRPVIQRAYDEICAREYRENLHKSEQEEFLEANRKGGRRLEPRGKSPEKVQPSSQERLARKKDRVLKDYSTMNRKEFLAKYKEDYYKVIDKLDAEFSAGEE